MKRRKSNRHWYMVFRVEARNVTWKFDGHCTLVDAVVARTEHEAELLAADRNPTRRWQWLEVRRVGKEKADTAKAVHLRRDDQVMQLRSIVERLNV